MVTREKREEDKCCSAKTLDYEIDYWDAKPIGEQWYVVFKWKYGIRPPRHHDQLNVATIYCKNVNQMLLSWSAKHGCPCIFSRRAIIKNYTDWVKIKIRFNPLKLKLFETIYIALQDKGIYVIFFHV